MFNLLDLGRLWSWFTISLAKYVRVLGMRSLLVDAVLAALLTVLVYIVFRMNWISSNQITGRLPNTFRCRAAIILVSMLLPVGYRAALLPWRPIPEPAVHDEFGHLLVADTLAAGRLANPPHPLWQHLDTIYVLQHPAYASVYPIGQGAILAVGKILTGRAWFGVLLATALMGGASAWALLEILPLNWAAVVGLIVSLTYGLKWVDWYWGGQFCAFGGALLLGALLRLWKSPSKPSLMMALLAATGWLIVWFIRPFESVLLLIGLWSAVAVLLYRARRNWKRWVAPIGIIALLHGFAGGLTLAHNHAVTGSLTTFPYSLAQQVDGVPQSFSWLAPVPTPRFRFAEMREMYFWQLQQKMLPLVARANMAARAFWVFFVPPWYSLPLFLSLIEIRDPRVLAAWVLMTCVGAFSLAYPFFFPHYTAAYCGVMAFLIVRGFMMLFNWSFGTRRIGRWLTVFLLIGGLVSEPVTAASNPLFHQSPQNIVNSREYISDQLSKMGGGHVVFVRYGPNHSFLEEWVYNAANIDKSTIVWCRWLGTAKDREVMAYYPSRQFWIADVDGEKVNGTRVAARISRYEDLVMQRTSQ